MHHHSATGPPTQLRPKKPRKPAGNSPKGRSYIRVPGVKLGRHCHSIFLARLQSTGVSGAAPQVAWSTILSRRSWNTRSPRGVAAPGAVNRPSQRLERSHTKQHTLRGGRNACSARATRTARESPSRGQKWRIRRCRRPTPRSKISGSAVCSFVSRDCAPQFRSATATTLIPPYAILCVITFLAGMTIIGSQTGVGGTCGKLYPVRMRKKRPRLGARHWAARRNRRAGPRRVSVGARSGATRTFRVAYVVFRGTPMEPARETTAGTFPLKGGSALGPVVSGAR
jgi:hypothetical protein